MNITPRERNLVFLLLVLLLGFIFFRFIYLPGQEQLQKLRSQQQQLLDAQANSAAELKDMADLAEYGEDALTPEEEREKLAAQLPDEPEIVDLLQFLHTSCQEAGLPLLALTYDHGGDKKDGELGQVNCRLNTSGSVADLTRLLNEIKYGVRLLNMPKANMTAKQKPSQEPQSAPPPAPAPGPAPESEPMFSAYYIPPPEIPESLGDRLGVQVPNVETAPAPAPPPPPAPAPEPKKKKAEQLMPGVYQLDLQISAYHLNNQPVEAIKVKDKKK